MLCGSVPVLGVTLLFCVLLVASLHLLGGAHANVLIMSLGKFLFSLPRSLLPPLLLCPPVPSLLLFLLSLFSSLVALGISRGPLSC